MQFLGYYSEWPVLICLVLIFALAACPLFQAVSIPAGSQTKRLVTMDGTRGILALAVVFHHAAIYHRFLQDGVWTLPPSHFFTVLGPIGVALFFMITGFLFWSQLIRKEGKPNWKALYVGRIFRIGPLFVFAVTLMLGIVAYKTHFHLHQHLVRVVAQLVRWLSFGIFLGPFVVNGDSSSVLLLAGVTWTLQWEWFFYFSMPVLAIFARRQWHLWSVMIAIVLGQAYLYLYRGSVGTDEVSLIMLFLLGMLSASLRERKLMIRVPDALASTLIAALFVFVFRYTGPTTDFRPQLALGLVLYLIVNGGSLFGLLKSRAAIRLGDISYGIYLLQGLVLAAVFRGTFSKSRDLQSPTYHWLLTFTAVTALVLVAMLTHLWIELPGMRLGKKVAGMLQSEGQRARIS